MPKKSLTILLLFVSLLSRAQGFGYYGSLIEPDDQKRMLSFFASEAASGRCSGSLGNAIVGQYVVDVFRECALIPVNWTYTQSLRHNDSTVVRNVLGILPSSIPSDEYVIVSAHYDHLGTIGGRIYAGADDNASGLAAMLSLAKGLSRYRREGGYLGKNIIFVAFDGKELNMCGSEYFVKNLPCPKNKILCDVNIDMLGTDLVPPGKEKEYIFEIGEETLPHAYRGRLSTICFSSAYKMDLDQSFYGSRDFRKMFYSMSDQISFQKAGIPAVVFSSAFHHHTYKVTDTVEIINFPLLYKRTMLIFRFIVMVCD